MNTSAPIARKAIHQLKNALTPEMSIDTTNKINQVIDTLIPIAYPCPQYDQAIECTQKALDKAIAARSLGQTENALASLWTLMHELQFLEDFRKPGGGFSTNDPLENPIRS